MKALLFASCTLFLLAGCQQPQVVVHTAPQTGQDGLTVSGTATVRVKPTLVVIRLGASHTSQRPVMAKAKTEETLKRITDAVLKKGVGRSDIQTDSFTLQQAFNQNRLPAGWACSSNLEIRVKAVESAGDILEAAIDAGATSVSQVEYTVEELQKVRSQAREEASKIAKDKAQQYARTFGVSLGKPKHITESAPYGWSYGANSMSQSVRQSMGDVAASTPDEILSSGSVAVTLTVHVRYSL